MNITLIAHKNDRALAQRFLSAVTRVFTPLGHAVALVWAEDYRYVQDSSDTDVLVHCLSTAYLRLFLANTDIYYLQRNLQRKGRLSAIAVMRSCTWEGNMALRLPCLNGTAPQSKNMEALDESTNVDRASKIAAESLQRFVDEYK